MRRKREKELVRVELPRHIGEAGFRAATSRTAAFVNHWAGLQGIEGAMSIHELVRQVYLQGLWDGCQLVWNGHLPADEEGMKPNLVEFAADGAD